jgi:hypothetical protein
VEAKKSNSIRAKRDNGLHKSSVDVRNNRAIVTMQKTRAGLLKLHARYPCMDEIVKIRALPEMKKMTVSGACLPLFCRFLGTKKFCVVRASQWPSSMRKARFLTG